MASVKICPTCGVENSPGSGPLCRGCGTSIATVSRTAKKKSVREVPIVGHEAQATDAELSEKGKLPMRVCRVCKKLGPPGIDICDTHGEEAMVSLSNAATVKVIVEGWPWGGAEQVNGFLRIGRLETFSQLAPKLATCENISRRHAELFLDGGSLFIKDLGSTNGTFLDDIRLPVGKPELVSDGARIRFGENNWSVTIRIRNAT